jgi:signal transduction histidine kinase
MRVEPLDLAPIRATRALLLFGVLYAALVWLGYGLREPGSLTIIWPGAGLLFVTLWFAPARQWLWVLLVQITVEVLVDLQRSNSLQLHWSLLFAAADSVDGMVGASIARVLVADATQARILQVTECIGAAAAGAAVSATLGALAAVYALGDVSYAQHWQIWWAGNWLGSLTIGPVVLFWALRWRLPDIAPGVERYSELLLHSIIILGATVWIFSAAPTSITTLLQLPFILIALFVVVSFRVPPRWAVTLAAATVLLAAWFASQRLGPFAIDQNHFARVISLQLFCATLVIFMLLLGVGLLEKQRAVDELLISEQRYRYFVAQSPEAVWRLELREPMPAGLQIKQQMEWLKAHAYTAEYNNSYRRMRNPADPLTGEPAAWHTDVEWSAILENHLQAAARQNYTIEGLRYSFPHSDGPREYWAALSGVHEAGQLTRIWGVAQDITALTRVSDRLERESLKLRQYALDLSQAEERARRTTAVDLHDGIGQLLFALGMNLGRLRAEQPANVNPALVDAERQLKDIQRMVGTVIADLSPPGLYDLGLLAALKWLAHRHELADGLRVTLDVMQPEPELDPDTRALVFRVVRELLRNVVKHAGTDSATVQIQANAAEFLLNVSDAGIGSAGAPADVDIGGFGLFSIRERLQAIGGSMVVATAAQRGFRVEIRLPYEH